MFLELPAKSIGYIGGGKTERTGCVDVAVIQSLYRKDDVKDFVAEYGQVIVDARHHISAFTCEQLMRQVKAKYVVGLTVIEPLPRSKRSVVPLQPGTPNSSQRAKARLTNAPSTRLRASILDARYIAVSRHRLLK